MSREGGPRRARVAVSLLFLVAGVSIGVWTARIPAIQHRLQLGEGELSIALLAIAAGAFTGMQFVGRLVDRYGTVRVMIPAGLAQGAVLVLPAAMPTLASLVVSLTLFGIVHGVMDVSMNANAVEVERAYRRPLMSSFHAVFSIGGFLGAATGGLFAWAGAGPLPTFAAAGAALIVLSAWAGLWARPPLPAAATPGPAPRDGVPAAPGPRDGGRRRSLRGEWDRNRGVLLLGALAFCCFVGEGAAADWSSVYLRGDLGSSDGFAAAAYAAFSITMTAGRLVGDRLAARLGPVRLVRWCGVLAGAGLGAALLVHHPVAGVIGFACFGAGLSCTVPQVFSAAGNRDPARAGRALARVASTGYLGMLLGPVLIGAVSELIGLPRALAIPAVLALFVALTATALRVPSPAPLPAPAPR
ncbi:MFS transporter [Sphaerisporangium sp. TRM90804]|uniref:MFS transporter n=1 Tax=Sphaerisporangium sp. TRM90804 TaxID=3031113 RepID=UPI002449D668|nr:MFS transporter [Sphaerisporangium sp. TRM90804]MDH2430564.1 MFS transporter [Sphaerisporangium sp. TRM90804]